jgi:hypothetical protein
MAAFSEAQWQALKDEMRTILIGMARMCATITYSDLAAIMMTAQMHHRAPLFHQLIRDMDADETAEDRPSLAALVVRKDSGIPGGGFYADAPVVSGEIFDPVAYWQGEFDKVCAYWGEK